MNEITELAQINFSSIFISVFVILIGVKTMLSLFEWFAHKLGLETKWMRTQREAHELLLRTSQALAILQEKHETDAAHSDLRDDEISNDIKKLTQMFVEKEIDDMRWEINNFATQVSEGKPCNKDSFQHEKYEKILKENELENGEVEISMELINQAYKQTLTGQKPLYKY